MGVIVRTAAAGASLEELQWDLRLSFEYLGCYTGSKSTKKSTLLIYRDDDLISRSLRDF